LFYFKVTKLYVKIIEVFAVMIELYKRSNSIFEREILNEQKEIFLVIYRYRLDLYYLVVGKVFFREISRISKINIDNTGIAFPGNIITVACLYQSISGIGSIGPGLACQIY